MKITKFVHSCVLVEEGSKVVLFDPGGFTWDNGSFDLSQIKHLDSIAITHSHGDHLNPEFVEQLIKKFPKLNIVCNDDIKAILEKANIEAIFSGTETDSLKPFLAPHEDIKPMSGNEPPDNQGYHFEGVFSHPGDSFTFVEPKKVLAMPLTAPWGSVIQGISKVLSLKPEYMFLIHDWHYGDRGREWLNERMVERFAKTETEYLNLKIGETVNI